MREQAQVKVVLAERDERAGVDVARRHGVWLSAMDGRARAMRSAQRAGEFAALAGPLRVAYARAWQEHRDRFGIARGTWMSNTEKSELVLTLPSPGVERDEGLMDKQLRPGEVVAAASQREFWALQQSLH